MQQWNKRLCAILLTLCMLVGFLPLSAKAALLDSSDYIYQQLYLGEDITFRLYGNVSDTYADQGYATVEFYGNTYTYRAEDYEKDEETGMYRLTVDLAAAQMTDVINLKVNADSGDTELINADYTAQKYLQYLLEGRYNSSTKDLCKELLNYGADAQLYFNYNTEDLANAGYEIEPSNPVPTTDIPSVEKTDALDGVDFYGTSVVFLSELSVRFYFTVTGDVADYTFTAGGNTCTPVKKGDLYYIEVTGITPEQMDTKIVANVTDGSNALSVAYAPSWFFIRSYNKTENGTYKDLLASAYSYFMEAKSFAGVSTIGQMSMTYSTGTANSITVLTDLPTTTPCVDFTLSDNGCKVDEGINSQAVSTVGMSTVDGKIALTFNFDAAFEDGQTFTLPGNALFGFTDYSEYDLDEDYVFEYNGTAWDVIEPVAESDQLLGFDSYAEITGANIAVGNMIKMGINTDTAYISQGTASLKVEPQGDYSVPGKHPYFKIDFAPGYYTGSTTCATSDFSSYESISFDVYNPQSEDLHLRVGLVADMGEDEYISTIKQAVTLNANSWTTVTYDLSVMAGFSFYDFSDIRYMTVEFMEHKESRDDTVNVLYIDDLVGNLYGEDEGPVSTVYDYESGVDFETHGHEYLFIGQGNIDNDATIERVAYEDVDAQYIDAIDNGGDYALKLSTQGAYYPTFRIHFGQVMPAGATVTFDAYAQITNGENLFNKSIFEFSGGSEATVEFACGTWTTLEMVLQEECEYVDLFWNVDRAQFTSAETVIEAEVYIDNIVANSNVTAEGDILDGLAFDIAGNAEYFTNPSNAAISRVTYESAGIDAPTDGGDYALQISRTGGMTSGAVSFVLNFGQTLAAGTTVTFDVYANTGWTNRTLTMTAGNTSTSVKAGSWHTVSFTLAADATSATITFSGAWVSTYLIYIDNVKAVEPAVDPEGDFLVGVDFEVKGNAGLFVGQGSDTDATIKRVAYSTLSSISVPTDGGDYALKVSSTTTKWPAFRINFGKELKAGTKLSFMAYGTIDGESNYNQSIFEYTGGGEATTQFAHDQWVKLTITLSEAASCLDLFWNYDRASITSTTCFGAVYLDNFLAVEPVDPTGDFEDGVDFETAGNEGRFENIGGDYASRDAVIEKVAYADISISKPTNGGDYALKLTHASSLWPVFRINFNETLKAGTELTFDAYTNDTSGIRSTVSIFEYVSGGEATVQYYHGSWNTLTLTLTEDCSYVDLVCTLDRWNNSTTASNIEVYLDNFKAVQPVQSGDILEGYGFEDLGNLCNFTGIGADQDASIYRVNYANIGVSGKGGDYALKVSHTSHYYPTFQLNFGQTLAAGTTVTFDVYGWFNGWTSGNDMNIEFTGTSGSGQVVYMLPETWFTASITLTEETDHLQFFYNIERNNGISGDVASYILIDNVLAVEPIIKEGDFLEGVGFEKAGNALLFTAVGGDLASRDATMTRVSYEDAGIDAPTNGGDYALKLTHSSNQWPVFRIEFDRTLAAGTVLTFDAYTNDTSGIRNTVSIFEYVSGGDATAQYYHGSWNTLSVTLNADCSYIDLMCNMDRWKEISAANIEVYVDNFLAVEPALEDADFLAGVTFENAGHVASFAGTGNETSDATIERVSYADLGINTLSDGGDYALKVSHDSYAYPTFRINFGKTLKAGTTITFDAYAYTDGSVVVLMDSTWTQAAYLPANAWRTDLAWEITLSSDCDYIDMLWESRGNTNVDSYIIMDNIVAVEPDTTFQEGVTFEDAAQSSYFSGTVSVDGYDWRPATLEVVSFDGDNALKLTCANSQWPGLRINLGKTYPAGTIITFDAYTNDTSGIRSTVSIFEALTNCTATDQYYHGSWNTLTVTLTADCSYIELMCNMDRWNEVSPANLEIYMDNFYATEPISQAITFEYAADTIYFTDADRDWSAATIERLTYEELGIGQPEDGGDYALKLSHGNDQYPTFRINFGKTLAAGTTIKMDVYGTYTYDGDGSNCVVLNVGFVSDNTWGQGVYMGINNWYTDKTLETTLSKDSTYVDFYWEPRLGVDAPSYIVVDNIEFTEP